MPFLKRRRCSSIDGPLGGTTTTEPNTSASSRTASVASVRVRRSMRPVPSLFAPQHPPSVATALPALLPCPVLELAADMRLHCPRPASRARKQRSVRTRGATAARTGSDEAGAPGGPARRASSGRPSRTRPTPVPPRGLSRARRSAGSSATLQRCTPLDSGPGSQPRRLWPRSGKSVPFPRSCCCDGAPDSRLSDCHALHGRASLSSTSTSMELNVCPLWPWPVGLCNQGSTASTMACMDGGLQACCTSSLAATSALE
mmetsp:Transcript_12964/g.35874  ORF Transcript_12964/g.35874 Transcript_12964/m.35874 type:complete len:258 (+) Transcript_12964:766-1539(+)